MIVAAFREGANQLGPHGSKGVLRVSVDTGESRWIYEPPAKRADGAADAPAVSPDGRTLAFIKASSNTAREIQVQPLGSDAEPSGPAFALHTEPRSLSLAWEKGGKAILFESTSGTLCRIEARPGAKAEVLHAAGAGVRMPAVSGDGHMAWTREFRDTNIWEVDLASGSFRQLIATTAADRGAAYAPDGKRIALNSQRSGTSQIWVCDSDGKRCAQVSNLKADARSPSWSPDGTQLAFHGDDGDGHNEIYLVDVAGGVPRRLTRHATDAMLPSWSQDGRSVYFSSPRIGSLQIWKVPPLEARRSWCQPAEVFRRRNRLMAATFTTPERVAAQPRPPKWTCSGATRTEAVRRSWWMELWGLPGLTCLPKSLPGKTREAPDERSQ